MLPRILLELAIVMMPFAAYGLYRLAINDAEVEGRKAWPITLLFGIGIVLAALAWLFLLLREDRNPDLCDGRSRLDPVTGQITQDEDYECGLPLDQIGIPVEEPTAPAEVPPG